MKFVSVLFVLSIFVIISHGFEFENIFKINSSVSISSDVHDSAACTAAMNEAGEACFNENSDLVKDAKDDKDKCCATWDIAKCIKNKVGDKCSDKEFEQEINMARQGMKAQGVNCDHYPYGSSKCHFPWWGIGLIVIGCLAVLGGIAFGVFMMIKRR
jgi:hypothetical protein